MLMRTIKYYIVNIVCNCSIKIKRYCVRAIQKRTYAKFAHIDPAPRPSARVRIARFPFLPEVRISEIFVGLPS